MDERNHNHCFALVLTSMSNPASRASSTDIKESVPIHLESFCRYFRLELSISTAAFTYCVF